MTRFQVGRYENSETWYVQDGESCKRPGPSRAQAEDMFGRIMATPPCEECGDHVGLVEEWHTNGQDVAADGTCFSCHFWRGVVREGGNLVHGGWCHQDGGAKRDGTPHHCLGYAGRWFRIVGPGIAIETNNLWNRGKVPPHFRDRLPDNCTIQEFRP